MKTFLEIVKNKQRWIIEMLTVLAVFAVSTSLLIRNFSGHKLLIAQGNPIELYIFYAGVICSIIPVFYLIFQAVLVCFYKPVSDAFDCEYLPGCSVIVPAYNEGEHVAETLRSLLRSDYPADKLEIIAINDGSQDDTWNWIKLVAGEAPDRITAIDLEKNGGKKHALAKGFTAAKNELVLTIDSDSTVAPDTISNLVLPFADPAVGGAAGVVRVRNIDSGFVPRMLDICFVFSCDFMRSAQSVIGSVLCSPGAISAYRKSAVLPHLDEWLNQKFLGRLSTIGEDRALTSILLRNGFRVVLQSSAAVETCVPTDYQGLCRTLIRWTRGDVREGLMMIKHFFRRFDLRDWRRTALQINLFCQLAGLIMPLIMLPCTVYIFANSYHNLPFILSYMVAATWLWATIPAVLYAQRESPLKAVWAFVFALFSLFALSWVCIYSWVTMSNSKWLTRNICDESKNSLSVSTQSNTP